MPHALTMLAFVVHVSAGTLGLFSGIVAAFTRKGGRLHRTAGTIFIVAMLVMAAFAAWLAVVMPGQTVNLFIAAFTAYLVTTAWLTLRRRGWPDKAALAVGAVLCAPFLLLSLELALGAAPFFKSAVKFQGPVLIAIYSFTTVLVIAVAGDLAMVLGGGPTGVARLARHLWRMLLGLTLAAGSAFTNGFPRLLPASVHVPLFLLFVPQLSVLGLLVVWMVRVRLMGWRPRGGVG